MNIIEKVFSRRMAGNPKLIDAWDRFDVKMACLFTGNAERAELLKVELGRVGISDVDYLWQFPNPLYEALKIGIRPSRGQIEGFFNSGMGHYRAIRIAHERGFKKPLIFEDDIRFLNDKDLLADIVDDLPDDYDVALLDVFPPKDHIADYNENIEKDRVSKYWVRAYDCRSVACYSLNETGMEKLMWLWERPLHGGKAKVHTIDKFLSNFYMPGLKIYRSVPNACVQTDMGRANSGAAGNHYRFLSGYEADYAHDRH